MACAKRHKLEPFLRQTPLVIDSPPCGPVHQPRSLGQRLECCQILARCVRSRGWTSLLLQSVELVDQGYNYSVIDERTFFAAIKSIRPLAMAVTRSSFFIIIFIKKGHRPSAGASAL